MNGCQWRCKYLWVELAIISDKLSSVLKSNYRFANVRYFRCAFTRPSRFFSPPGGFDGRLAIFFLVEFSRKGQSRFFEYFYTPPTWRGRGMIHAAVIRKIRMKKNRMYKIIIERINITSYFSRECSSSWCQDKYCGGKKITKRNFEIPGLFKKKKSHHRSRCTKIETTQQLHNFPGQFRSFVDLLQ